MTAPAPALRLRATHTFPHNFKWGTATAAFQVEGQPGPSDWAAWSKVPANIRGQGSAEVACDWWNGRWQQDFDLAAQSGQNTHRLSLDWSRIEPRPAVWDEDALDYYRQMVQGLRARGMAPMITLHHFISPEWFSAKGGWQNPQSVLWFQRYVRKVVTALKGGVDLWCTLNEINIYAYQSYLEGLWPPQQKSLGAFFEVTRNMLLAHAAAYRTIHELQPEAQVGLAHHVRLVDAAKAGSAPDQWVANFQQRLFNQLIPQALTTGQLAFPAGQGFRSQALPELKGTLDFLGVNYYSRTRSAFDISKPLTLFGRIFHTPGAEVDNMELNEFYPEGLYRVIKWAQHFKLPLYITENGWGDVDENRRVRALILHLKHMWQAINFNWPVYGYYYWTLVDNFEWERGWAQPFGLYALDQTSQTRTPRPVANLYAEVCRTNTLSSEMVERYAPELFGEMFPMVGMGDGG